MNLSPLQKARYEYVPKLPGMLRHGIAEIAVKKGEATTSVADQRKLLNCSRIPTASRRLLLRKARILLLLRNR